MILVTGGAGFIGANFILDWLSANQEGIINLDKLTYAGNLANLAAVAHRKDYVFIKGDILDAALLNDIFQKYQPTAVVHFAAESHVDRSITGPRAFLDTNVVGTFQLLESAKTYWEKLPQSQKQNFRFLHVSTDEVYGSLNPQDPPFCETTAYAPNSPYSASKAASDHFVRAYYHTYGLPTLISNCSNNYGPLQFPEKLIPRMILNALENKPLPIYGDGLQIRDWLYVTDHCRALAAILANGQLGETYVIGGCNEKTNRDVVETICAILDEVKPKATGSYRDQITHVTDRLGHDRRYAISPHKIESTLKWLPSENFTSGIRKTVAWYLENTEWLQALATQQGKFA